MVNGGANREKAVIDFNELFTQIEPLYGVSRVKMWRGNQCRIHLALMQGDFLASIIDGSKAIESRFSQARIAPVGRIDPGDLIVFKQVGSARMAVAVVDRARSGVLDEKAWKFVRAHLDEIGIDESYLQYKSQSRYYALAWVRDVHEIKTIAINKRDRRSWVVLTA